MRHSAHGMPGVAGTINRLLNPQGNSLVSAFQMGKVHAKHTKGGKKTLDIYMSGATQMTSPRTTEAATTLTKGIRYLHTYTPTVGDIVIVARFTRRRQTCGRFVLGKLA